MHIAAEGVYVEILDVDKQGLGRVIVTDLLNQGTPLIRYEIGDLCVAKVGTCMCGRGLPLLGRIIGRTSDILYTPEGNRISGISVIDNSLFHVHGIRQVQVIQDKLDELTFNIVKDGNFSEESLEIIAASVRQYFGQSMKHKIIFVDKIPLSKRGKLQLTICKLKETDIPR
jgi:phenylacetate-CoA ligase